jgi:hypothetical protein
VHSSTQDQRHWKHLAPDLVASTTLAASVSEAAKQEYVCRSDAEVKAKKLRALQSTYHQVEMVV